MKTLHTIRHSRQLWQARYSPCGEFLVACGYDATIQRWNVAGEEPVLLSPIEAHNGWVQGMCISPDGERVYSADSWGRLSCHELRTDNPQQLWTQETAHEGWIRALAISSDGKQLATGGNSGVVRLWNSSDGARTQELSHEHPVGALSFHPKGRVLATGDLTGIIREWNLDIATEDRQLDVGALYNDETKTKGRIQQCGGIRTMQFSADGQKLVCGGQKDPGGGFANGTPCVLVFDWKSGGLVREMPMGSTSDGFAYDVQFHPEGYIMATSSAFPGKGPVWFWRPEEMKAFFSDPKMANGRSLSLHPNGQRLAHLISDSRNGNGRPLKDGEYRGGEGVINILEFELP